MQNIKQRVESDIQARKDGYEAATLASMQDPSAEKKGCSTVDLCPAAAWNGPYGDLRDRAWNFSGKIFYRTLTMSSLNAIFSCPGEHVSMCTNTDDYTMQTCQLACCGFSSDNCLLYLHMWLTRT